jgi:aminopeptidase N
MLATERPRRVPLERILVALALLLSTVAFGPGDAGPSDAPAGVPRCGPEPTAGALGAGDPYFPKYGNGGYDVQHYDLAIRYAPATRVLRGVAAIEAEATQELSCFSLDLDGMTVRSVEVNGAAAARSRAGNELKITPAQPLADGAAFTVVVRYDGVPQPFVLPGTTLPTGFIRTSDGFIVAGEPESAATWFPVNDHPTDAATYSFRVTVPAGLQVVANGLRESVTSNGERSTYVWQASEPMASYLATVAVGDFRLRFEETGSGVPLIDAVHRELGHRVDDELAMQPAILSFLESRFGAYPFESVGAIVTDSRKLGFALETQTRPIYPPSYFPGAVAVIVHEIAHQWFGDLVAVERWQHIWLNEGFATYAEWLWTEDRGRGTAQERFQDLYRGIPRNHPFWRLRIGDPGPDALFDDAVYERGAMTLQALRNEIGRVAFFDTLHAWVETNAFGTGTTEGFIALAEQESGQELDELFDVWLFTARKPPPSAVTG